MSAQKIEQSTVKFEPVYSLEIANIAKIVKDFIRASAFEDIPDNKKKDVLKGAQWLLLKRPENLKITDKHDEKQHLAQALELNAP